MVKIIFSLSARRDLKEIVDYIKKGSEYYALLEKEKIKQAIDKIPLYPLAGRIVPEQNNENIREIIFRNYRIMYDIISDKQINILTIHHHSRSLSNNPGITAED